MVNVYIWDFTGKQANWGHAAVEVTGGSPAGIEYISWWPESAGRRPKHIHRQLYCAGAIPNRTKADDIRDERAMPSHVVHLAGVGPQTRGLDETKIKNWWNTLRTSGVTDWCTLGPNCSTIAACALDQGGGNFVDWFNSTNIVWTPDQVLRYALALERGIRVGPLFGPGSVLGRFPERVY